MIVEIGFAHPQLSLVDLWSFTLPILLDVVANDLVLKFVVLDFLPRHPKSARGSSLEVFAGKDQPHSLMFEPVEIWSDRLCSQCSKCDTNKCPPTEAYPHMTAFDDSLIAGALQSDYVDSTDRGVYSVPDLKGGESASYNSYFGWQSTSGSASGYHRFSNYMDKCSEGQSYLTVDKNGKVSLRGLSSLESLAEADWKSINPPKKFNHREFRFWVSHSTGKCLTVFGGKTEKRTVGVADCKLDGSNVYQLFAFRFHYHKAFCCCGLHNN